MFIECEVRRGIRQSDVDRSDVFINTKLWISDYSYDHALRAVEKSATTAGVESFGRNIPEASTRVGRPPR
ncbi:hypothetical protein [Rothia uropygialis]|uniref:hypothetical protein n=1 Tax=Kocuria sp. 36 TaxID=1415402 RepID=UPI00101C9DFF|nr:hypothetical protein [Kocuria sp. 36]